jgi:hypothetical protein
MFRRRKDRKGGDDSPHEVFLGLRGHLLAVDPAEFQLTPSERLPRVWAVFMEMGLDTGIASLVAVADGTTSLYLSTGGGVIGAGEHDEVRHASEAFLDATEAHLDRLQPASQAPLPQTGAIRFHALTFDSIRSAEVAEGELADGRSELTPLFYAGNDVLTQIRLTGQPQR